MAAIEKKEVQLPHGVVTDTYRDGKFAGRHGAGCLKCGAPMRDGDCTKCDWTIH